MRLAPSPPALETQELVSVRSFPSATKASTPVLALERWSSTPLIPIPQLALERCYSNTTGPDNTAVGADALVHNVAGEDNNAVGAEALEFNGGTASNNTAVGAVALFNNVDGSENTAVGKGAGQNVITGFNNTYVGDFVGTLAADESDTIRIGDVSNGNGAGSEECYIGGIWNNFQPVNGSNVVQVTLNLDDDHLGWDFGPGQGGSSPVQRSAPQRRSAPNAPTQRPAMLDSKVGKIEKLKATVAQQQKQIETLTAQLRKQAEIFTAQLKEQASQIQKVSARLATDESVRLADLK